MNRFLSLALGTTMACSACAKGGDGADVSPEFAAKLCKVLTTTAPEVKGIMPQLAEARLAMAISAAFDTHPADFKTISDKIDDIATASCPDARTSLMSSTHKPSLRAAFSG